MTDTPKKQPVPSICLKVLTDLVSQQAEAIKSLEAQLAQQSLTENANSSNHIDAYNALEQLEALKKTAAQEKFVAHQQYSDLKNQLEAKVTEMQGLALVRDAMADEIQGLEAEVKSLQESCHFSNQSKSIVDRELESIRIENSILQSKLNFIQRSHDEWEAKAMELQRSSADSELVLLQLHQVQKELESIFTSDNDKSLRLKSLSTSLSQKELQFKEVSEEAELVLLQLHQVQEELEHYFLDSRARERFILTQFVQLEEMKELIGKFISCL